MNRLKQELLSKLLFENVSEEEIEKYLHEIEKILLLVANAGNN